MDKKVLEILITAILGIDMDDRILSDEEREYLMEWIDDADLKRLCEEKVFEEIEYEHARGLESSRGG